jgi:hypothetical protein
MSDQPARLWHLAKANQKLGTFTSQQLADMGKAGQITSDMVVWRDGMDKWQPAAKVKGLTITQLPPAPPPAPAPQQPAITVAVVPAPASQPMPVSGHVTIEKTGKALKMQQLLSLGLILLGFTIMAAAFAGRDAGSTEVSTTASAGSAMFVCGLFWRVLTRVRIWWHHG